MISPGILALFGLCIGSFLNVVVHRLPRMMERQWWAEVAHHLAHEAGWSGTFSAPRPAGLDTCAAQIDAELGKLPPYGLSHPNSSCPSCGHAIRWYENIPVVSWLWLKRRCAACGAAISARYPLVEIATAALFALAGWRFGPVPATLLWCGMLTALVALTAIDWDTTLLPDSITLPLLWAGLVAAGLGWTVPLPTALWGAVTGYLALWSVYWLFKLATGRGAPYRPWQALYWVTRAATGKEGMGFGDFKLLAALGAWLGWQAVLPIVLMASIIGALVGILMKMGGALREGRYVPFGPFLAGGGVVVLLAGMPRVLGWIGWA